jgi:hypothetical protein
MMSSIFVKIIFPELAPYSWIYSKIILNATPAWIAQFSKRLGFAEEWSELGLRANEWCNTIIGVTKCHITLTLKISR